ncbi:MAG: DEAD/DEAH box helicase [Vicinamibacterales bacterium]|nr:DEAD/DEAH box helicase [Vicinamibacterales bacterium]
MRGAPPRGLSGSTIGSGLSHGQRDAALLEALAGLVPFGSAGVDGAGACVAAQPEGMVVTAWRRFPAEPAQFADYPDAVDDRLRAALAAGGIARPYVHQAEAMAHALEGRHVVTITPTASGKTLCYNAPALSAILRDPATRALYLFPTKALAQDQLAELLTLTGRLEEHMSIGACTYDGDTPQDARRVVRGRAHLVLSNPDMLHSGILPHHPRWAKLFENLRFVVIDELHAYRGVFGSHLANILRRLRRVCAHYGSSPVFICSSATIANPRELAERLTGERFALVERNGAPRGEKFFALVTPPVVNPQLGIRRSYVTETRRLAVEFLRRGLQVIVFAQSRLITEVLTTYIKQACRRLPGGSEAIRGYRGGYLPLRRRDIERGLRAGTVSGVVSTSALELGIDIGALDVCVMAGYPGTIAATWQRAGRAGRRSTRSAAVMVASSAPIDQFIVQHPAYFFDASPEHALINPDNLQILLDHIKCAAFELPFTPDEQFGQENLQAVLGLLREEGFVDLVDDRWHWMHESYPADAISLRSVSSDNFVVVDVSDETTIIGEVDFSAATSTLYEQAIYLVEGAQYQVSRLDFDRRKAYARPVDSDYYTDAITSTKVTQLEEFGRLRDGPSTGPLDGSAQDERGTPALGCHGEVHVVSRVVGFKKIKFYTNENVGSGELDLPEQEMHTTAYWLTLPRALVDSLPFAGDDRRDGIVGLGFALRQVAQLLLMCDRHDIGLVIHGEEGRPAHPAPSGSAGVAHEEEPTIFIYDNYPGGIGFSEPLFGLHDRLLGDTRALIERCPCEAGCPACVGPIGQTGPRAKPVALALLVALDG